MKLFLLFAITFLLSVVSIFLLIQFSRKFSIYDRIDERKVHTGNIPRLGGIGIFFGFLGGMVIFFQLIGYRTFIGSRLWVLLLSSTLIFIMGVWDDVKPWRARYKLLVQVTAAVLVLSNGFVFTKIGFAGSGMGFSLGFLAYPLTFCWIIGVTNAINLIDGIDGLAGTVSLLSVLSYSFFFFFFGNSTAFYSCIILALSIFGFLMFNLPFPRAKIFMGDGGSQFLGFFLAVLPLFQSGNNLATISLPYAAAILSIPIFDTIAAIWRRVRENRPIDDPDKFHLHHKLMMLGFSARGSLVVIFSLQMILCVLTIASIKVSPILSAFLLVCVFSIVSLFFTIIHIKKQEELVKAHHLQEQSKE